MLQQPQPALPRTSQPPGKEAPVGSACFFPFCGGDTKGTWAFLFLPLPHCYCIRPDLARDISSSFSAYTLFLISSVPSLTFQRTLTSSFLCIPTLIFSSSPPSLLSFPKARHYYQIIKRPMDLSIIRRKLQKKDPAHYTTPEEVVSDVRLMFWNCAKFNYVCWACFHYFTVALRWA